MSPAIPIAAALERVDGLDERVRRADSRLLRSWELRQARIVDEAIGAEKQPSWKCSGGVECEDWVCGVPAGGDCVSADAPDAGVVLGEEVDEGIEVDRAVLYKCKRRR